MLLKRWLLAGMLSLLLSSGLASAQGDPDTVVEQYVLALTQGRFAEARALTLEAANLDGSIFGSWLFGRRAGLPSATADLFLSQKFVEGFRYTITGTTVWARTRFSSPRFDRRRMWGTCTNGLCSRGGTPRPMTLFQPSTPI